MTEVDVLIVGAGLSGIGAAARLEQERPGTSYLIVEARAAIGGTWDLFRYPGVRADTDVFTLGYAFRPWAGNTAIADGAQIRDYIRAAAAQFGIESHIRFRTTAVAAAWSSETARWTVTVRRDDEPEQISAGFVYLCAGYYDYERGHQPDFPGAAAFAGQLIHPQFWPEGIELSGKNVVVIGSGATAVTLIPALAGQCAHVTMLQRSPSYILSVPAVDAVAVALRKVLPDRAAHAIVRAKNMLLLQGVYEFSRRAPRRARSLIRTLALRQLKDPALVEEHFNPSYEPWDQRLCIVPDGDLFKAIRSGAASVVTDHIEGFTPDGITLRSGRHLPADVVVAATGLQLKRLGGVSLRVDGVPVDIADTVAYRALMLSGVPNLAFCFGYSNNSWTLRADLSSRYVCALLGHLAERGYDTAVPTLPAGIERKPFLDLSSGYVQRSIGEFPAAGDRGPWVVSQDHLRNLWRARRIDVTTDMTFRARARNGVTTRV